MNMDKRTQTGFLIALIAILLACCVISESHSTLKTKRESFVFKIMGTVASFTFEDYDTNSFRKDCISARKQFDRILNVANLYDKNSELVRLNNSAYEKDFICSDLLWQIILEAEKAYYFTGGAYEEITRTKQSRGGVTVYKRANGEELYINPGKTMINIISPSSGVKID